METTTSLLNDISPFISLSIWILLSIKTSQLTIYQWVPSPKKPDSCIVSPTGPKSKEHDAYESTSRTGWMEEIVPSCQEGSQSQFYYSSSKNCLIHSRERYNPSRLHGIECATVTAWISCPPTCVRVSSLPELCRVSTQPDFCFFFFFLLSSPFLSLFFSR